MENTLKNEATDAGKLHEGRAASYQKIGDYHRRFIDPETGRFASRYTRLRPCPACDADSPETMFESSGGTYVQCSRCTMVYINPVFRDESLNTYYQNLDTGQAEIVARESAFYREIYGVGLDLIAQFRSGGAILDIGCSAGGFLDLARERGWRTFGIELGAAEGELCRKKGHTLYTQDVKALRLDQKFDAICMWDVFEHIPDGKAHLRHLRTLLAPAGVIFLQIPNSGGLAPRVMRSACRMFDGVEHVNLYNPKTIRLVAEASGLEVAHMKTVISEIAVLNNYLSYRDPYFGRSDFGASLADAFDADLLHANLLGYKIQAVLKQP